MNILFDLDGTLTDPKQGITKCIQYALEKLGAEIPDNLDWCIGPPLQDSFHVLLSDKTKVDLAVQYYRERFSNVGMYENTLYSGIIENLQKLKNINFNLFLATSKPIVYASKILTHFELSDYFNGEYGSALDGTRKDKTDLIEYIVNKEKLAPGQTYMIGDRKHDLIGAKNNNVQAIAVSYGYGPLEELEAQSPKTILHSPNEIGSYFYDLSK
ncbi:MAG: HAD hydrolase-like protein [Bdellovibrionaceae bacterium]|nr:HAD hydrolase-like protein [Pseudobdellovibrionaceae bacterium]